MIFTVDSMQHTTECTRSDQLSGTWDSTNPIGGIIQGHTNLTEIKQAADLLWRNNVPPRKVMLGTGFYGRSFELEDAACTKPGCHFSGAAKKGKCTNSAGTLAYFGMNMMTIIQNKRRL